MSGASDEREARRDDQDGARRDGHRPVYGVRPGRGKPRPYISGKLLCLICYNMRLYRMLSLQVHV